MSRSRDEANAKIERRRAQILESAGDLFMTKGFEGTTTLDIARAAGISKRDLYAAFATKEDILGELVRGRIERVGAQQGLGNAGSRAEVLATLHGFALALVHFLTGAESVGLYRLAIAGVERQPEVGRALIAQGIGVTTQRLVDYTADAVECGHLAPMDVEAAIRSFLSIAIGTLQMRALLDPAAVIDSGAITGQVDRALAVLLTYERPSDVVPST